MRARGTLCRLDKGLSCRRELHLLGGDVWLLRVSTGKFHDRDQDN